MQPPILAPRRARTHPRDLPRVAVATEHFFPAVDGTTTAVRHVVDRLIDRGHQVLIIAAAPGLASYRGAQIARIAGPDRVGKQVSAALREFAPDLVHAASSGRIGCKSLKHARKQGVATVAVQTAPVRDGVAPVWQGRVAHRADVLLATSPWLVNHLSRLSTSAEVWQPGVDTELFHPGLREQQLHDHWSRARKRGPKEAAAPISTVVGYTGRIDDAHGIRRLVDLADLPGIRLVVIGDGPQLAWLKRRLPHARFTGHLGTNDLARAVASLDLLVHPGEAESCCHSLREAAACGVPVVAPRAGGAVDVVRHLETGLLYGTEEYRSFRVAVSQLAADTHRSLMGQPARDAAQQRTWVHAVDELIDVHYARALSESTSQPTTFPDRAIA